jgi:hypothetical protein
MVELLLDLSWSEKLATVEEVLINHSTTRTTHDTSQPISANTSMGDASPTKQLDRLKRKEDLSCLIILTRIMESLNGPNT